MIARLIGWSARNLLIVFLGTIFAVAASQTMAVRSSAVVTIWAPLARYRADFNPASCPLKVRWASPLNRFQTIAVLSRLAERS